MKVGFSLLYFLVVVTSIIFIANLYLHIFWVRTSAFFIFSSNTTIPINCKFIMKCMSCKTLQFFLGNEHAIDGITSITM